MGIHENSHHVALGLVAAVAAVPGPAPDPEGALVAAPAPGPEGALEAAVIRLAESPAGAAAAAAAAEGAAALVVTRGGRDGRRILRSWLFFSTTFANPSTPTQTSLSLTSSTFARPLLPSTPLFPSVLPFSQTYFALSLPSLAPPLWHVPDLSKLLYPS